MKRKMQFGIFFINTLHDHEIGGVEKYILSHVWTLRMNRTETPLILKGVKLKSIEPEKRF